MLFEKYNSEFDATSKLAILFTNVFEKGRVAVSTALHKRLWSTFKSACECVKIMDGLKILISFQ